ncbi:MAG: hypothetical protein KatS3mg052_2153 [Candidatus Roseilinea sp.]|nr:MAG: hypothetical protein KatS3mg052_2153 [Candidatus Roseilinea sp.]
MPNRRNDVIRSKRLGIGAAFVRPSPNRTTGFIAFAMLSCAPLERGQVRRVVARPTFMRLIRLPTPMRVFQPAFERLAAVGREEGRVERGRVFLNPTAVIRQRLLHLVQASGSKAAMHPAERALVRRGDQLHQVAEFPTHQQQPFKVAAAHLKAEARRPARRRPRLGVDHPRRFRMPTLTQPSTFCVGIHRFARCEVFN